jgi:hypothetical protein
MKQNRNAFRPAMRGPCRASYADPGSPTPRECLAMLLRPGNAGSNTFTDHREVLAAAFRQVPARLRRKILVRVDGAGASHELIEHLLSLSTARRTVLFTCGR